MKRAVHRKFARFVYYVLFACVAVLFFITLWMGVDMVWEWYMSEQIMKVQNEFSSAGIPSLIPLAIEKIVFAACNKVKS